MTRILVSAVALALGACAGPATAKPIPYVFQAGHTDLERGPDGNSVILDSKSGLLVIDTGRHPEHAKAILEHAAKAGKPVAAVINTHWHLDHSTGNRDILKVYPKARLIASNAMAGALEGFLARSREGIDKRLADPATPVEARQRMERAWAAMDDRSAIVPAEPVVSDRTIRIGGRRIEVHLAHNAATEGDVWLVVPDEKLAIVGDLVVSLAPFFDTGCEEGWTKALEAIGKARWTTLVPGHGKPMNRSEFDIWHRAFIGFLDCARSTRTAEECSARWQADAAPFISARERADAHELVVYYIKEVLRAPPSERMSYCRA